MGSSLMEISKKKNERIKHPAWMCVYGSNIFSFNRVAIDSLDIINTEADGVMFAYDRSDIYVGACKDEDAYYGQFQQDKSFRFGAVAEARRMMRFYPEQKKLRFIITDDFVLYEGYKLYRLEIEKK